MSTVWFMVDDTDTTSLAYSEPHSNFAIASTKTFNATRGPAYNNTLHSTTHKASITFNFNGTSFFGVYGSLDMVKPLGTLPDITCSLDGFPTSSPQYSYDVGTANNNYLACFANSDVLSQNLGEHELVIDITNSVNSTWFFDYLTYESLPNPILNGEMLQAGNQQLIPSANYSMLSFGPGWVNQEQDDSIETNVVGSEVTINFNGTQLALYGDLNSNVSNTAPYQVDERAPVGFEIQGSGTSSTLTNTALFNTDLSIEEHKVVVTFNGSTSGNPLDINYFLITSLTQAEQASLPGLPLVASHHHQPPLCRQMFVPRPR
ncbi:hypothetical protein BT96DRAFT_601370 [Gymnopus androsaceus JB14]|uniref:Uncharacterized protein n=1 Tax=Gymnopus androsaceus JB14 TaxID=1447944 RepID=A0A6A4GI23_9AGAR|nr:hypothetical protein BT96DRAFT_601370 [Gymnopus androsaceus JB14]